jgi:cell division protein FtsB
MNHEEYKEMLELAALDALGESELRALQTHLAECEECRAELAELRDAAAALVYLTTPVKPPAELRARILESVRAPGMRRGSSVNAMGDGHEVEPDKGGEATGTQGIAPVWQLPHRQRSAALRFGAMAASVLFIALVILLVVLWNRNRAMQAELASLSRRNEEMQSELNRLSQRNNELQEVAEHLSSQNGERQPQPGPLPNRNDRPQVETPVQRATNEPPATVPPIPQPSPATPAPDTHVVELAGTNKAPQAHARLVYDSRNGVITLTVSDLPPAPVGKAYQLWFMIGGHAIPGGVFVTGPEGQATMHGQVSAEARNAKAFVITLENSNGSNKPTGAKYLLGANS